MEQIKTDNDRKKPYLRQYQRTVRRLARIEEELAEVRAIRSGVPKDASGIRGSGGLNDLSSYAAELDRLEQALIRERYKRIQLYTDITERIRALDSQSEQDVLFYRYLKGMSWWEIAEKMHFSERQVFRIHGKALFHVEIPKDVSKCQ